MDNLPIPNPPPSGKHPPPKKDGQDEPYSDDQLLRDLVKLVLSADFPSEGDLSFKAEIAALKEALSQLQESFPHAADLNEQLKLTSAISHLTSSLARLVRAQDYLRKTRPSAMNQAMERAIQDTLAEWGWT